MNALANINELARTLRNMIRTGVIANTDPDASHCRVQTGGIYTDWLQWLMYRAGGLRTWWAPSAHFLHPRAGFGLFQRKRDLFFGIAGLFHNGLTSLFDERKTGDALLVALLCLALAEGRWTEVDTLKPAQIASCRVIFLKTKNSKKRTVPISAPLEKKVKEEASGSCSKMWQGCLHFVYTDKYRPSL